MVFYLSIITLLIITLSTIHNYQLNKNSFFLSGYLIILSLYGILHYFIFQGSSILAIAVLYKHISPLFYLPGAMLYFYVKRNLKNEFTFAKKDLWHLLPFCIGFLNISPYFFVPFTQKIDNASYIQNTANFNLLSNVYLFYPFYISSIIRCYLFFGYTIASCFILYRYWKISYNNFLENSKKNLFKWCLFLSGNALILSICFLLIIDVFYMHSKVEKIAMNNYNITLLAGVTFCLIPIVMIFHPQVIYGVHISRKDGDRKMLIKEKESMQTASLKKLAVLIIAYFEKEKPYLIKNFSLDDLAKNLEVPKHHLYNCLNVIIGKKFIQLRTHYRIEHAKKLLLSNEMNTNSLQGIWMESGFSSKTNFFTTFKEETGLTPTEFIYQQKHTISK